MTVALSMVEVEVDKADLSLPGGAEAVAVVGGGVAAAASSTSRSLRWLSGTQVRACGVRSLVSVFFPPRAAHVTQQQKQYNRNDIGTKLWGKRSNSMSSFKERHRQHRRCVDHGKLHPESKWRQRWNLMACLVVLACCVQLPIEMAYFDDINMCVGGVLLRYCCCCSLVSSPAPHPAALCARRHISFIVNTAMDCFFFVDIILNFCTGYWDDGHLEMDGRKIANHYIRGWFFLDVVATVPFDVILTLGVGYNGRAATSANVARLPRLARILRMSRLARLLRLPRLFRYTSAGKGQAGGDVQMMNSGYVQGALLLLLLYFYFYYY